MKTEVKVETVTVKEMVNILRELAHRYGSDLQFNVEFANGEYEFGEYLDFIEKFNFYRFLHSRYLIEMNYSYADKHFKVTRLAKDELKIEPVN